MGKKLLLFLACILMTASMAFAQTKQVTGTVVDSDTGEPIVGAAVKVKGTNLGVLTDVNGKFTLQNLPTNSKVLVVSFMGMKTEEVPAKNSVTVALTSSTSDLDEVMVVAYGTATKSSFTGSAGVVGTEQIEVLQSTNALDALTGHVAGVELFNATGDPTNNAPSIRIRGISSISAGTSPLIVLDGTPYPGDMNTINTADIESMTVLKDAAASALYGSRAANGVIVITTKKGKVGQGAKVSFDAKWGSNSRARREYETVNNPAQYYEMHYASLNNYAQTEMGMSPAQANVWANNNLCASNGYGLGMNIYNVPAGQLMIGTNGKMNPNATLGNIVNYNGQDYLLTSDNWLKEGYSKGLRQEYNVNVSNATDKGNFYASFGYTNNEGITYNSNFENINGRLKADIQAKSWLKLGGNMSFTHYNAKSMLADGTSNSSANIFAAATQIAPIYPVYIRDGQGNIMIDQYGMKMYDWGDGKNAGFTRPNFSGSNAIQSQQIDLYQWEGNAATANGFAEIRFAKDFKFSSINTVNLDESRSTDLTNPYYGNYATSNGILGKGHGRTLNYTYIQQLDWGHVYGKHDVNAMVGHEWYDSRSYRLSASKSNMFDPTNLELAGAVTDGSNANSYTSRINREGYQGRVMYNYDQKYFFSAGYRRDASSRFSPEDGHRWGNFYSVGGAWLLSQEKFMKELTWVDLLKFKASYGEMGNDNISNYLYTNRYSVGNSGGHIAATPSSTKGNKDITWETVGEFNTGIEFELFKNRLSGGIEYYWRNTSDMLYFFSLPVSSGYTGYYDNIGDMVNQGVEIELNADIFRTKDFTWNVGVNLSHNKNKITRMPEEKKTTIAKDFKGNEFGGYASGNMFIGQGLSLGSYYMPVYAGVYNKDTYTQTYGADANTAAAENGAATYDPKKEGMSMWWKDTEYTAYDENGDVIKVQGTNEDGTPMVDEDGNPVMVNKTYTVKEATTSYSGAEDYVCDNLLPKLNGGFNTRLEFKGFDLSLDFAYQLGGKVLDSDYSSFMSCPTASFRGKNFHADLLNAYSATNTGSQIPRMQWGDQDADQNSTRFLTSASYLNLQNINFGYTLPASVTRKAKIDKIRLYLNASNVWLWSKRQGLDPRTAATNLSYGSSNASYYSTIRTISGGVSVTF